MIIGITIPSLIALFGGVLTYGYINDIKNRQIILQTIDEIKESVLEIRRNEKNFLLYKNAEQFKNLNSSILDSSNSTNNISLMLADKIGLKKKNLLSTHINQYSGLINALNKNFQKEQSFSEAVRKEGRKLESSIANHKNAKELSTSFVLHIRLLEKNYMFFRDKESADKLNKSLLKLKNVTPLCYDCIPYVDAVRKLFGVYDFSDSIINDIHIIGDKLEEITGKMSFLETQKINSFISTTQRLLLIGIILLCVLGPLFVYKTASYISSPIKRLSVIANKISGGDITLRAPLKEKDETYSLAISFNSMLDNLQTTQQTLKESLDLLNEKQAQLIESEKRASLGFLVAGVAHELNNPLNNISLTAETINENAKDISAEETSNYIQDILRQSDRAHKIVNNLLDYARARKSEEMEKQDIINVVNDSFNLIRNQLKVNNIQLKKEIPDKVFFINGNRSKLEQILVSIIMNAVQSMKDSGILTVQVLPDNDTHILIKISDTGAGIAETDLKNIFEPFYTTKAPGEGTGLGLAVCHTLVDEHKGEISVESELGAGSTFTIKIPLFVDTV